MKVSGFTFVRNAILLDFPVVESITSILPICDEFIVNVGHSEDDTLGLIKSIQNTKIRIIETPWNLKPLIRGCWLYDQQMNIALFNCTGDWCFYLQADEVVHEEDLDKIKQCMVDCLDDFQVEGMVLNYIHFYGSYNFYRTDRRWCQQDVRIVRNGINVYSYMDAQTFCIPEGRRRRKLKVMDTGARLFHYGWVREPEKMKEKILYVSQYGHTGKTEISKISAGGFDYLNVNPRYLVRFEGTHPAVMKERIARANWNFDPSKCHYRPHWSDKIYDLKMFPERILKRRFFVRHPFVLIKRRER